MGLRWNGGGARRRVGRLLLALGVVTGLGGCGAGTGLNAELPDIAGRVTVSEGPAAAGAVVYLARLPEFPPAVAMVVGDSTQADRWGHYRFSGLEAGRYHVFAGIWDQGGDGLSLVSPPSRVLTLTATDACEGVDLALLQVAFAGTINGEVRYVDGAETMPAENADVHLIRYRGGDLVEVAGTVTDARGRFEFVGVKTGNYAVSAVRSVGGAAPIPTVEVAESAAFFCDGVGVVSTGTLLVGDEIVRKPAIYLYPETTQTFTVALHLGEGVRLVASEPPYGTGWEVSAAPSGLLDGRWPYLFYEVALRPPLAPHGWCLDGDQLPRELADIVGRLGLNENETRDLLDYWLPALPRRAHWVVRPVTGADLDAWVALDVQPAPDSVLRVWLVFEGRDAAVALPEPATAPFVRRGITLVEWGGLIVR